MTCLFAHYSAFLYYSGRLNPHTLDKVSNNKESRNIMLSHWLPPSLWVPSKNVFNSLYAMVKSKSCVQSLSRFQSNLRVISGAFPSILSFPRIWLAGRLTSAGRLFELVPLPAATLPLPRTSPLTALAAALELYAPTLLLSCPVSVHGNLAGFLFFCCTFFFFFKCDVCVGMTQQTASAGDQTQSDV